MHGWRGKRIAAWIIMAGWFACIRLPGDEGMWLPHQLNDLGLAERGLRLEPAALFRADGTGPANAVVNLNGGTGAFVSADGLILTNHHVVFSALQRVSDPVHDYVRDGIAAAGSDRTLEICASGLRADILLDYTDVTGRFAPLWQPGISPLTRCQAIDRTSKRLVAEAEKKGPDLFCQVKAMYGGNRFYLYRYKRLRDIRFVYVPPQTLGNFGGEVDNWMWPRHTCDFSLLRAYVSKKNSGASYSPKNVPYRPRSFLRISSAGFQEGDFVFIAGYPGITNRNATAAELAYFMDSPRRKVSRNRELIDLFEAAGENSRSIQIKYSSKLKGLYNGMKNAQAKIAGGERSAIFLRITERDERLRSWIRQDPARRQKYGDILGRIARFMNTYADFNRQFERMSSLVDVNASTLLSQSHLLYRYAIEREKPDLERDAAFQERNANAIRERLELAERSLDLSVDKILLAWSIRRAFADGVAHAPAALRLALPNPSDQAIARYAESLCQKTILSDLGTRLRLLRWKRSALLRLQDPLIALAAQLENELSHIREKNKEIEQEYMDLKRIFEGALLEAGAGHLAPDANGTMRFTSGTVIGYTPRDAVAYLPQTTLGGMLAKETGLEPFMVPQKLKELARAKNFGPYADPRLDDVPACFLTSGAITGGNSGSPVLNAHGELIGVVFDMTYESVVGDTFIIPELQRVINLDIRFALFVIEKYAGLKPIIKEMGAGPSSPEAPTP